MIQDKIFFDEKDPTGLSYNTPFTFFGSYQGRLWSKTPTGSIKFYTQNSDLSVYATTGSNQFSGSQTVTGSLTVTGGITGSVTTASYVEYTGVANKPALVSGSSQVTYSGLTGVPSGIVSSSAQVGGYGVFATTGSNQFNGSQAVTGSLTVTGQVVAQTLNVQQVTSSIVYSSGSNIFGNSLGNTQQFTGSVSVTGSLTVNGAGTFAGSVGINGSPGTNFPLEAYINSSTAYTTSSRGNVFRVYNSNTSANVFAGIELGGSGTANDGLAGINAVVTGNGSADITFYTRDSNTFLEKIRITSGGNLLVGTPTDQGQRLLVQGTGGTTGFTRFTDGVSAGMFIGVNSGTPFIHSNNSTLSFGASGANTFSPTMTLSSGNVGIGTASPSASFHVVRANDGGSGTPGVILSTANGANDIVRFQDGTTTVAVVKNSGDLGVGVSSLVSPGGSRRLLQISNSTNGALIALGSSTTESNNPRIFSGQYNLGFAAGVTTGYINFYTNDTERMRITSGGNVGIGVVPSGGDGVLQIISSAGTFGDSSKKRSLSIQSTVAENADQPGVVLGYDTAGAGIVAARTNSSGQPLAFWTYNGSAWGERMRITSTGNVGIGTTSPSGYGPTLQIAGTSGQDASFVLGDGSGTTTNRYLAASPGSSGNFHFGTNTGDILIKTGLNPGTSVGTERMRITSSGLVTIGNTSPASGATRLSTYSSTDTAFSSSLYCLNSSGANCLYVRGDKAIFAQGAYDFTSSGGTAVHTDSAGQLFRFTSSLRYKKEIIDYTKGLSELLQIKPKSFKSINSKEGEKIFAGLIAEQIDEIGLTEFVEYNDEGQPDAVHYSAMTALLIKSIQELKSENDTLKSILQRNNIS